MTLFDAVYGDAYAAVERLLESDKLNPRQIRSILGMYMTPDGVMEAEQKLTDGSWPLLKKNRQGDYERTLPALSPRPLTMLELRWLKSLCVDERAPLFLTDTQLTALRDALQGIEPVFAPGEVVSFDAVRNGDNFSAPAYRQRFHTILLALREEKGLFIGYTSYAGQSRTYRALPEKLEYSAKDRRFRLHASVQGKLKTFNLGRIVSVRVDDEPAKPPQPYDPLCREPLVVQVSGERNALERFMLEFSCYKKESTFDPATGKAVAKVWYPQKDETEVLIRVLGFGPMIRVTGPEAFVQRIRERINMQSKL